MTCIFKIDTIFISVLLLILILISGCASLKSHPFFIDDQDYFLLQKAVSDYEASKYSDAKDKFTKLANNTDNSFVKSRAHLGLASISLIKAENEKELSQASKLWQKWAGCQQDHLYTFDKRLIWPILNNYHKRLVKLKSESAELKEELQKSRNKTEMLEDRLQYSKEKNQNLHQKLEALEKLYKELQDKRKNL